MDTESIMQPAKSTAPINKPQLLARFGEPTDCLAAWLMLEGAEVLAGAKPANLVNLKNRPHACGKNLYAIWRTSSRKLLANAALSAKVLAEGNDSLLIMLYDDSLLQAQLDHPAARKLLIRMGYPPNASRNELLEHLAARCAGSVFPHEIGIFLGYPLKDVVGFMGLAKLPFACQGPWKIYGNAAPSLDLACNHKQCRIEMSFYLASLTTSARHAVQDLLSQPFLAATN